MAASTGLAGKILDLWLKATAFTGETKYISLHTADPGATGASEVTGGSYARQQILDANWDAAVAGVADNAAVVSFTLMPAVTVTHVGIWDAVTAGNFRAGGALAASKVVNLNDTFEFPAGDLDVTIT